MLIVMPTRSFWLMPLLLVFCCLLTSCHHHGDDMPPPVINSITPTGTIGNVGDAVMITASVTAGFPVSFGWTLSGGGTITGGSTTATPTITLSTPGTFSLDLTVTDAGGTDTDGISITVDPAIPVVLGVTPSGDIGKPNGVRSFHAGATSSPTSWLWTFDLGDGPVMFTTETVEITLPNPGTYSGSVVATNANGDSDPFDFDFDVTVPVAPGWTVQALGEARQVQITIVEHDGKPAILSTASSGRGVTLSLATTETPSSETDWTSHVIDAEGTTSGGHSQLVSIDGRLAACYLAGGDLTGERLKFAMATVATPTSASDWAIYELDGNKGGFSSGYTMAVGDGKLALAYISTTANSAVFRLSEVAHPEAIEDWETPAPALSSFGATLFFHEGDWFMTSVNGTTPYFHRSLIESPSGYSDWADRVSMPVGAPFAALGLIEGMPAAVQAGPFQGEKFPLSVVRSTAEEPDAEEDWEVLFVEPLSNRESMNATLLDAGGRPAIFATNLSESKIVLLRSVRASVLEPNPWKLVTVPLDGVLDGGMDAVVIGNHYLIAYFNRSNGRLQIAISDGLF
ncbi:MAG: PKD domain-containing protein [bacterium]